MPAFSLETERDPLLAGPQVDRTARVALLTLRR
jgi:hypothetical protein